MVGLLEEIAAQTSVRNATRSGRGCIMNISS